MYRACFKKKNAWEEGIMLGTLKFKVECKTRHTGLDAQCLLCRLWSERHEPEILSIRPDLWAELAAANTQEDNLFMGLLGLQLSLPQLERAA